MRIIYLFTKVIMDIARNFISKRNYTVTVEVGGDYYDDCYCNTMNAVYDYIGRFKNRILVEYRDSLILPTINITIKDYKSV